MIHKKVFSFIRTIVLIALILPSFFASASSQKVLVLHSYHQGLEWTDSISAGIQSILSTKENDIEVYYDYLDTKRNSEQAYLDKLVEFMRAKKQKTHFDLIITSDNNALAFLKKHSAELYPNTPIVFCGVNFFQESLIEGLNQVTGVVEKADVKATIELMLKVHPSTKKILIFIDQTPTGLAIRKNIEIVEDVFKEKVELEYYTDFSWSEVEQHISSLGSEYLIYLLTANRDNNNKFLSYLDGIDLVNRAAKVPIYGSWDFYIGKGIMGGVITSGFSQGEQAATIALDILSGKSIQSIPINQSPKSETIFDFNWVKKFGVEKNIIPNSAIFINQPITLLTQLKKIPTWILTTPFLAIILLMVRLSFLRIKQRLIIQTNIDLDKRVKDKTMELNASNKKLHILINTIPTPVFYKNLSGEYQACNEAFAKSILGVTKEKIIGKTLEQLNHIVPKETIKSLQHELNFLNNNTNVIERQEYPVKCAYNSTHDYIFSSAPTLDSKGCVTGIITTMTDISEKCIAQKEKEKLINKMLELNMELEKIAIMDSVTGTFNRHYISQKLTEEFEEAITFGTPLTIIMLDIDHFKKVNDNYGHQFGDIVLKKISQIIVGIINENDLLGRYGGEEYLLILPQTSINKAVALAERIRNKIESYRWEKPEMTMTISGGVAEYSGQSESILLREADNYLYQAKAKGRNLIISKSQL